MLTRLVARNFLLIREARLELSPHLNVLTGETGTGKSLVLGALGLALGAKAKTDWVGPAGDELHVEAAFRMDRATRRLARSFGLPVEGEDLVLVRRVRRRGGSSGFVNGQQVLQRVLRRLGASLVEIHGQREEERFRIPEVQRDLLDLSGGLHEERRAVRLAFEAARDAGERLRAHRERVARLAADEEWIRYQLSEIDALSPEPDELDQLQERARDLREGSHRAEWIELAGELLNDREGSVLEALETLDARAEDLPDEAFAPAREALKELRHRARELVRDVQRLAAASAQDVDDLPAIEERLARLEQLQRKHRKPLADILTAADAMRHSLEDLADGQRRIDALNDEAREALEQLGQAAERLTSGRRRAASELTRALEKELAGLGMKTLRLRAVLEPLAAAGRDCLATTEGLLVGPYGAERVRIEGETNPGAGMRPLGEIASGGEMARVALAMRVVLGQRGRRLLTVFDEIDTGLGATAARSVVKRLQRVARHRQVLLVTHMPVIAAGAQRHFRVGKRTRAGQAAAHVEDLSPEQRTNEIARMLSGDARDERAYRHAQALLTQWGA